MRTHDMKNVKYETLNTRSAFIIHFLEPNEPTDGQTDRRTDGPTDGQTFSSRCEAARIKTELESVSSADFPSALNAEADIGCIGYIATFSCIRMGLVRAGRLKS